MKTRTMILCALFAALTAVGAFFKISGFSRAATLSSQYKHDVVEEKYTSSTPDTFSAEKTRSAK